MRLFCALIPVLALALMGRLSAADPTPAAPRLPEPGVWGMVRFAKSPPQSEGEQVRLRIHAIEQPPPYDVSQESFAVLLPKDFKATEPQGLFIWISAGNDPKVPKDWEKPLSERKLIAVGAANSGNKRDVFDRIRMAVDANANLRECCRVDGRRVYVAGFSGGGRVASMIGVAFGEMFSGTACFMGVNFYTDTTGSDGKVYGLNYLPDEEVLGLAKKFCRYALVTGSKDFNRPNTIGVLETGFRKEGFANARLFDIPNQGHAPPSGEWLGRVLDYLDEGKR